MDAVKNTQIKFLVVVLLVIITAHVLLVGLFVGSERMDDATEVAATQTSETTASSIEKPGFFARLFGKKEVESTPISDRGPVEPELVFPPHKTYHNEPVNPNFGRAFDYSGALRGDIPEIPLSRQAKAGILVDLGSRKVLWAKNEKNPRAVASMTKMMTLLVAFDHLERSYGVDLDTEITVTRETTLVPRTGIVGLRVGERLTLRELCKASVIRSANDAAYLIADYFSGGDVEMFIAEMNSRALDIGMTNSRFVNPHGLPNKVDSTSTPEDMVLLAEKLLDYPDYMRWSSTQKDAIRNGKIALENTNRLVLPRYPGVDGMKTGYTRNAGYCLTASSLRNGRRLMLCVMGFEDASKGRDPFARRLLDWGYQKAEASDKK